MTPEGPHSRNLRKGRFSAPGMVYFVTSIVVQKQPWIVPAGRDILIEALKWSRDNRRIWLLGYVIMDNHFHTLFMLREGFTLAKVMMSVKRHGSREINKLLNREGEFWQEGYHDHMIRDEGDFWNHFFYMHNNPVKRGWVPKAEDYPWSTAHLARQGDVDWQAIGYAQEGD